MTAVGLWMAGVSGLALHLSTAGAVSGSQASHDIPFDFATRQPIIPVKINGGAAVPFVVDTGASIHLIDREIAKQANVAAGRSTQLSGGGQAAVDVQFVDGLTLETGPLSWTAQRGALASLGYPDRKHFAGLLGAPILMRYTVQFASRHRRYGCSTRRRSRRRRARSRCRSSCRRTCKDKMFSS